MSNLKTQIKNGLATVRLNRVQVKNAFDGKLIAELVDFFKKLTANKEVRVVILGGEGDVFCAGADLNWMKSFAGASSKENEADARALADLLMLINTCSKPVIGEVKGAAMGGGVGLLSVCDIVIASKETRFALSEVRLGLAPAIISPFVISKIGSSMARRYFLTGERFDTTTALRMNLIHEVVEGKDLESRALAIAAELLKSGPQAVRACKEIIRNVHFQDPPQVIPYLVKKIAELRAGEEGQEGMKSFFEKRNPRWQKQS